MRRADLLTLVRSWKTTTAGGLGAAFVVYWAFVDHSAMTEREAIGVLALSIAGTALFARDSDKTSEAVGLAPRKDVTP